MKSTGQDKRLSTLFDQWGIRFATVSVNHPMVVLLISIVLVGLVGAGAKNLEFSNNYRVFFSKENPELTAFESFQANYTKNDNILIVIEPKKGKVFTPEIMGAIEDLTEQSWQVPYANRVDSVTNFQRTYSDDDDLVVEDLFEDAADMSQEEVDRLGSIALAEPLLNGSILNHDATVTALNITLQYPEEHLNEVPEAVAYVREMVSGFNKQHPELNTYLTGLSMLNNAFAETGQGDGKTLMPIMFAVLIVMIFVILRSISTIAATLLVIVFSMIATMGFAGHVGIKQTPISMIAPIIVMTLAIADSIHILLSMVELMRRGKAKTDAIIESMRINFQAVTLTSLTTMIGFLALNYSDAPPFWHLGNMTAFGIFMAFAFSVTALPALMQLLPLKVTVSQQDKPVNPVIGFTAKLVTTHHKPVLWSTLIIAGILSSMVMMNEVNDSFIEYFDKRIQFRNDTDFTTKNLSGSYTFEYSFEGINDGGVSEPEYLHGLEKFTAWLRDHPKVDHVYSYSDIIKRLNMNMHNDDPDWYKIPESRELAAQYLLLYEMSLPFGLDLNDRINIDKSSSRLTLTMTNMTTNEVHEMNAEIDQWIRTNLPAYMHTEPTGATVMFSRIFKRNTESMLTGNIMAISLITLMLMITLGSFRYGLLSIIPNVVPLLVTFGIWGLLAGQVGLAAAGVTASALGIIVDDTVHFMTKYLRALREYGYSKAEAVQYAFEMVGTALLANSIILIAGFMVLAYSAFKINNQLGMLTALAIAVALVIDFLLLPTLLMLGNKQQDKNIKAVNNQ